MIERIVPRKWRIDGGPQIAALGKEVKALRALILDDDILSVRQQERLYVGNAYQSYESAVNELTRKYEGRAEWGVLQTGAIIDVRAAFIIGQGVTIIPTAGVKKDDVKAELEFVTKFLDWNDLDREMAQEFAKEGELEGRFLGQLFWDEKAKMPSLRFRAWSQYHYKVVTDPNDYAWYKGITWTEKSEDKALKENEFVYKRFGGRVHQPDLPYPKVAKCITQIEGLDKALRDWREIDHLFAAPTPHVECETPDQAKKMSDALDKLNWKIKKVFTHTGKFSYASPDSAGVLALEHEITTLAKMISGTTGVPVHFLGLPDLMSNRATAENLMELVYTSTQKERQVWKGAYQEIIQKAMEMWNDKTKLTPLHPDALQVDIPFMTQAQWDRLEKVYLPLFLGKAISLEYLLTQIPGLDVEEELKRQEAEDKTTLEKFKAGPEPPVNGGNGQDQTPVPPAGGKANLFQKEGQNAVS